MSPEQRDNCGKNLDLFKDNQNSSRNFLKDEIKLDYKSDVFAIGLIFYYIISRRNAYSENENGPYCDKIKSLRNCNNVGFVEDLTKSQKDLTSYLDQHQLYKYSQCWQNYYSGHGDARCLQEQMYYIYNRRTDKHLPMVAMRSSLDPLPSDYTTDLYFEFPDRHFWNYVRKEPISAIRSMCDPDPMDRLSCGELLRLPYFSDENMWQEIFCKQQEPSNTRTRNESAYSSGGDDSEGQKIQNHPVFTENQTGNTNNTDTITKLDTLVHNRISQFNHDSKQTYLDAANHQQPIPIFENDLQNRKTPHIINVPERPKLKKKQHLFSTPMPQILRFTKSNENPIINTQISSISGFSPIPRSQLPDKEKDNFENVIEKSISQLSISQAVSRKTLLPSRRSSTLKKPRPVSISLITQQATPKMKINDYTKQVSTDSGKNSSSTDSNNNKKVRQVVVKNYVKRKRPVRQASAKAKNKMKLLNSR